eukprot:TRINITY_DN1412_c0_g1_i1.p1 TRINITY_DN1412_c0_g1~~TRINITY_DN1412_c0_g1_i1.p1  ORF type:complete len:1016 (-),score=160.34 TRINITY_DN1412_c0_g1_i1:852-3899(-)
MKGSALLRAFVLLATISQCVALVRLALAGYSLGFNYNPSTSETPPAPDPLRTDHFIIPDVNLTDLGSFTIEFWWVWQGNSFCGWSEAFKTQIAVFFGNVTNNLVLFPVSGNYTDNNPIYFCREPFGGFRIGSTEVSMITNAYDRPWCHVSISIRPSSEGLSHFTSRCPTIESLRNNTKTFMADMSNIDGNTLMIGRGLTPGTISMFGAMDELRIWDMYRTPEDIQDRSTVSVPDDEPGLFAYYRMDDPNYVNPTMTKDSTAGQRNAVFSQPNHPRYSRQFTQVQTLGATPLTTFRRKLAYDGAINVPLFFSSNVVGNNGYGRFSPRPPTLAVTINQEPLNITTTSFYAGIDSTEGRAFNVTYTATRASCDSYSAGALNIITDNMDSSGYIEFIFNISATTAILSPTKPDGISTSGGTVTINGQDLGAAGDFAETEYVIFRFEDGTIMDCKNARVLSGGAQLLCELDPWIGSASVDFSMCNKNSSMTDYFSYLPPVVTQVIPINRQTVRIVGQNFGPPRTLLPGEQVDFDGIPCVGALNHLHINCSVGYNITDSLHTLNITIGGQRIIKEFNFTLCANPCRNGGVCVEVNQCVCTEDYVGATCAVKLECNPGCQNGGECVLQGTNSTGCDCSKADGYSGRSCEIRDGGQGNTAVIAGATAAAGIAIVIMVVLAAVFVARRRGQRGTSNFIPLDKKDFSKAIYGDQLTQSPDKSTGDLRRLEELLIQDNLDLAFTISRITQITDADKVAKAMVIIFNENDKILPLMEAFINEEVRTAEQAGTLFRSSSIVSKMFKFYSRLIGLPYLYITIGPEMDELIAEELGLEVDPDKMEEGTDLDEMRWTLMAQSQKILKAVLNSIEDCPPQFRQLFAHVKVSVAERFPENINTTIGGFIFLRFFCPAVSSPEAYGIVEEAPSASARRLLILITKVLQNLSNDVEFGSKEPYMTKMNDFIQSNRGKLTKFFDQLVKPPTKPPVTIEMPRNIKPLSLSVLAGHLRDNLDKIENTDLRKQLQSILS